MLAPINCMPLRLRGGGGLEHLPPPPPPPPPPPGYATDVNRVLQYYATAATEGTGYALRSSSSISVIKFVPPGKAKESVWPGNNSGAART